MDHSAIAETSRRSRIEFIDGLRGIAILLVVLYHAYARWADVYAYGDRFTGNPLLNSKIAGVRLFFIISGFVILMSLDRTRNFTDFITRRWHRLFPAMLLCSVLILLTAGLFPERPLGAIRYVDLLPGLTFTGDASDANPVWGALFAAAGAPVKDIEGAFWSLFIEVRFYVVFGLGYFCLGRRAAIGVICGLYGLALISGDKVLTVHFGTDDIVGHLIAIVHGGVNATGFHNLSVFLDAPDYGWFVVGALLFLFYVKRDWLIFWVATGFGVVASLIIADTRMITLGLAVLFVLAISSELIRDVLASRVFLFLGFVSYPLYLLHENMMVAMIVKVGRAFPGMPAILIPVLPITIVVGLAWIVAKYLEPVTIAFLTAPLRRLRQAPAV